MDEYRSPVARLSLLRRAVCAGTTALFLLPFAAAASYTPGQTLDPACLPSDSTCIVTTWTNASSNIYYTSGNVGIGTTSPAYTLDINGTIQSSAVITKDPYLDVRAFGAAGNGVADDTAAIVAAIAASAGYTVDGSKRSSEVFFPCGTYNFTGLNITVPVILRGASQTCAILKYTPTTGTAITENYMVGLHDSYSPGLRDLEIKGSNSNYAVAQASVGLTLGGSNGAHAFYASGISIDHFGTGLTYGNNAYLTIFENSNIANNYVNFIYPASLTNSGENLVFRDTTFSDSGEFYDLAAGACVQFTGGAVMAVFDGGSFDDCHVDIPANSASHISFTNNHFETPGGYLNVPNITLEDQYSTVNLTNPDFYSGNVGIATALVTATAGTINAFGVQALNVGTTSIPLFALSGSASLNVYGTGRTTGLSKLATNTGTGHTYINDQTTGYVGIATTSPAYPLDVGGFINTTGINGGYKIDSTLILYASSTNFTTFVGQQAGAGILAYATSSALVAGATAVGYQAMQNATSAAQTRSTAVGYQALRGSSSNITGIQNTALGYSSLATNSTGSQNTAAGYLSLYLNTTGSYNSAFGNTALNSNTSGSSNSAIGQSALQWNQTGNNNTAIGYSAGGGGGGSAASFSSGTFLGYKAGFLQTGNGNTFIGYNVASTTTSGFQNIAIGYDIALPSTTGSLQLDIGNIIYGTNINGEGNTVSSGSIAIGTSTPYARLSVWGTDAASSTPAFNVVNSASTTVFAVFDGGNAQLSGTLTQSSDARLKTNILTLDASSSLAAIEGLNPVAYDWADPERGAGQYGFIAQEVQKIFPALVSSTSPTALTLDGTLGLNYSGLIAPIVKALQALAAQMHTISATVSGFAQSFVSDKVTTKELCAQKADGTAVCVSGDQLAEVLGGSAQPSARASGPAPEPESAEETESTESIDSPAPESETTASTESDPAPEPEIAEDTESADSPAPESSQPVAEAAATLTE